MLLDFVFDRGQSNPEFLSTAFCPPFVLFVPFLNTRKLMAGLAEFAAKGLGEGAGRVPMHWPRVLVIRVSLSGSFGTLSHLDGKLRYIVYEADVSCVSQIQ